MVLSQSLPNRPQSGLFGGFCFKQGICETVYQNVQRRRIVSFKTTQKGGIFIKTYQFKVNDQRIEAPECAAFVAGSAEIYEAVFAFDTSWAGFARTAVFECAGERREQLLIHDRCVVPWEILHAGAYLRVGVYGVSGNATMPTVYSDTMFVARGAEPSETAREHSPDLFEQIVEIGQQAADSAANAAVSAQAAQTAAESMSYVSFDFSTDGDLLLHNSEQLGTSSFALNDNGNLEVTI